MPSVLKIMFQRSDNMDAVTAVLPFIKDKNGNFIKNAELAHIEDK